MESKPVFNVGDRVTVNAKHGKITGYWTGVGSFPGSPDKKDFQNVPHPYYILFEDGTTDCWGASRIVPRMPKIRLGDIVQWGKELGVIVGFGKEDDPSDTLYRKSKGYWVAITTNDARGFIWIQEWLVELASRDGVCVDGGKLTRKS